MQGHVGPLPEGLRQLRGWDLRLRDLQNRQSPNYKVTHDMLVLASVQCMQEEAGHMRDPPIVDDIVALSDEGHILRHCELATRLLVVLHSLCNNILESGWVGDLMPSVLWCQLKPTTSDDNLAKPGVTTSNQHEAYAMHGMHGIHGIARHSNGKA